MNYCKQILDKIPEIIDFDHITVKNKISKSFKLVNTSSKNIYFKINHKEESFNIHPKEGILQRNSKIEVVISILPEKAEVLISNCKIILDENSSKIVKISYISKYPNLKISRNNFDFGNVLINKQKEMEIILRNTEKVDATFQIKKLNKDFYGNHQNFHLNNVIGFVPQNCSFLIKVKFVPSNPDTFFYESYVILVEGGREIVFNCYGRCTSLSCSISSKIVNFESIEVGLTATKIIRVFNHSEADTYFQFYNYNDGVYEFLPKQGSIKPNSNERVLINFKPRDIMSYSDRIFCIFKDHLIIVSFILY